MLHGQCILRLLSRRGDFRRTFASAQSDTELRHPPRQDGEKYFQSLLEKYKGKITFNSHLEADKLRVSYTKAHMSLIINDKREQRRQAELKNLPPLPVSLQYVVEGDSLIKKRSEQDIEKEDPVFHLPYKKVHQVNKDTSNNNPKGKTEEFDRSNIDRWMTNYDYFDDTKLNMSEQVEPDESDDEGINLEWTKRYGSPDPTQKISHVPCGGCGALLHCTDTSIPGYIPSEIFKRRTNQELKTIECQRCHFLKEYNIALNVNVHPDEYEKLLMNIENKKALVIVMVDLLDFPCSIWPGIVDIIGTQRPIIIVGNKVDLLPGDSKGYLKRIRESLWDEIKKTRLGEANIKDVNLISAKTGYGVEELISTLFKIWLYKGDVFLIGCTNVGKSSLFNALLQSDYCKVHAVDLIKRATVSRWPGTTLNLLKFPINRPSGWKIYHRSQRLKADAELLKAEKKLRQHQLVGENHSKLPTLIGHIGRSFVDVEQAEQVNDIFSFGQSGNTPGLNEKDRLFAQSKWFYDTPGVVHPEQILSMLTAEELLLALPKKLMRPKSYYLHQGHSIFIGGLARLDFLEAQLPCRFTVFCSNLLPVTITRIEDADEVYDKFLGTELLAVPKGSEERMNQWPGLTKHKDVIKFMGEGNKLCCGDVVLSSAGWVSVTAPNDVACHMAAWTPEARGVNVRTPSMLKHAIMMKGKRVRDTPAYRLGTIYVDDKAK